MLKIVPVKNIAISFDNKIIHTFKVRVIQIIWKKFEIPSNSRKMINLLFFTTFRYLIKKRNIPATPPHHTVKTFFSTYQCFFFKFFDIIQTVWNSTNYCKLSKTTPWRKDQKTFLHHGTKIIYGHFLYQGIKTKSIRKLI